MGLLDLILDYKIQILFELLYMQNYFSNTTFLPLQ